ncbi:hypothetical protein D9M71_715400 [compost metagenome]
MGHLLGGTLALAVGGRQACGKYLGGQHPQRQLASTYPAGFRQSGERRIGPHRKARLAAFALQQHTEPTGETKGQLVHGMFGAGLRRSNTGASETGSNS